MASPVTRWTLFCLQVSQSVHSSVALVATSTCVLISPPTLEIFSLSISAISAAPSDTSQYSLTNSASPLIALVTTPYIALCDTFELPRQYTRLLLCSVSSVPRRKFPHSLQRHSPALTFIVTLYYSPSLSPPPQSQNFQPTFSYNQPPPQDTP
jgi:hypothetical protein